jgi:hypothetical protein
MKVITEFEQGDVVFLNADRYLLTPMTIEYVEDDEVSVVWVSEITGVVLRDSFSSVCLMSVD